MTTTARLQQIDAIACIIASLPEMDVDAANNAGWTVQLRYVDHEYVSDNDYTWTSDIHLTPSELSSALTLAAEML